MYFNGHLLKRSSKNIGHVYRIVSCQIVRQSHAYCQIVEQFQKLRVVYQVQQANIHLNQAIAIEFLLFQLIRDSVHRNQIL